MSPARPGTETCSIASRSASHQGLPPPAPTAGSEPSQPSIFLWKPGTHLNQPALDVQINSSVNPSHTRMAGAAGAHVNPPPPAGQSVR